MVTPTEAIAPEKLTLDQVVSYWASHRPHEQALDCSFVGEGERLTWEAFERCVRGCANAISSSVSKGDVIGVICADGIDFHILLNALWRCGSTVLLIDRNWGPAIVDDLVKLVGCKAIFRKPNASTRQSGGVKIIDYPARCESDHDLMLERSVDEVALYATTSGTTDNPKCVAITHRKIRTAYRTCMMVHDFSRIKKAASLFELNSLGVLGICFLLPREVGAATKVLPTFSLSNISESWNMILTTGVDFVYLVPPLVRILNTLPEKSIYARRLLALCASAPVLKEELVELERRFPLVVFNSYGLTELTFAVLFGGRESNGSASDTIGLPVNIETRLVDQAGAVIEGPGRGELHIAGPMLTNGYFRNPTATHATWDGRWLRTGDIAERDQNGRYYIRGRQKDTVLRGGYTYYLHELEHYLRRIPGVTDACAFKGRDLPSGDELCVVVQAHRKLHPAEAMEWIKENLGPTKLPNALFVWEEPLPRNSNGKVLRQELVRRYIAGEIREMVAT